MKVVESSLNWVAVGTVPANDLTLTSVTRPSSATRTWSALGGVEVGNDVLDR